MLSPFPNIFGVFLPGRVFFFCGIAVYFYRVEVNVKLNRELRPPRENTEIICTCFQDKTVRSLKGHVTACVPPKGHRVLLCWAKTLCCACCHRPCAQPCEVGTAFSFVTVRQWRPAVWVWACSQEPWSCSMYIRSLPNNAEEGSVSWRQGDTLCGESGLCQCFYLFPQKSCNALKTKTKTKNFQTIGLACWTNSVSYNFLIILDNWDTKALNFNMWKILKNIKAVSFVSCSRPKFIPINFEFNIEWMFFRCLLYVKPF